MGELLPTPPVTLSTSPDVVNNPKTAGPETVVRLQALDGTWETCGVDRAKGIFPENVSLTSDSWGPKTATFDLKRDGTAIWPDVLAFTPVKIEVDGQLVWSGRVSDTPSRDGADTTMSIQCEGWQHHLDDDMYEKKYVTASLANWKDMKTVPGADVGTGGGQAPEGGSVDSGPGGIRISFPKSTVLPAYAKVGIQLDLGPYSTGARMTVRLTDSATAGYKFYGRSNSASSLTGATTFMNYALGGTGGTATQSFSAANRYVYLFIENDSASPATPGNDVWINFTEAIVYGSTTYEASNASTLKASTVVSDAVVRGCPLLTTDTSLISTTAEALPEYAPDGPKTPREHINAVNGFHGWTSKVDAFRRVNFYAKPSRPKYELGEFSQMETSDSAGSSGAEIYNKVIVTGQDPAGQPVSVTRYAELAADAFQSLPTMYWPNPSLDTDTTGWTVGSGTFARTTVTNEFDTSPAGGKLTTGSSLGNPGAVSVTATGTPIPGVTYKFTCRIRGGHADDFTPISARVSFGGNEQVVREWPSGTGALSSIVTNWITYTAYYTAKQGDTALTATFSTTNQNAPSPATRLFIDSLGLFVSRATLPDRRGFKRAFNLQVNSVLPTDGVLAAAIGDAWLANHATTTLKGDVTLTGPKALRDRVSGQPIPLYDLLANTDEVAYFGDRGNPDTGSVGRAARITSVTYTPADDKAVVTLDNTRTNFDVLLNRLGATS